MRCQRTEKAAAVPQKFTSISFKENFVRNIQIFIQSIFPEMVAFSYIGGTFIVKQCLDIRIQIRVDTRWTSNSFSRHCSLGSSWNFNGITRKLPYFVIVRSRSICMYLTFCLYSHIILCFCGFSTKLHLNKTPPCGSLWKRVYYLYYHWRKKT